MLYLYIYIYIYRILDRRNVANPPYHFLAETDGINRDRQSKSSPRNV